MKSVISYSIRIIILTAIIFSSIYFSVKKAYVTLILPTAVQVPGVVRLGNYCTGFVIHQNFIATAAHCVEGHSGAPVKIVFADDTTQDFKVIAEGPLDYRDFAILEGDTKNVMPLNMSNTPAMYGEICASIGYGGRATIQHVSPCQVAFSPGMFTQYVTLFADVIPGDSGSPVISMETSEVIGVAVRSKAPVPVGLATPIKYVREAFQNILEERRQQEAAANAQ